MTDYLAARPAGARPLLVLGAMNFGKRTSEAEAARIVDRAADHGIRLIDTANVYNEGESERIVGRLLRGRRDRFAVATKVGLARVAGRTEGLGGARVRAAVDESLARLGVDRVDLYYLHAPDHATPIEETVAAVDELRRAGKIAAAGVSNYASWQILEMFHLCDVHGWARPAVSQLLYNVAVRQLELEYFKFTARHPIHTTVYNPLAGGLLAGGHTRTSIPAGSRFDHNTMYQRRYWTERMFDFVEALGAIADAAGLTLVQLAYAWLAARPGVDSILIGPGTVAHLDAAVAACALTLAPEVTARVAEVQLAAAGTDATYAR